MYFGKEIEEAIIEYNRLGSDLEKQKLFNRKIYPALNKLAENVIHSKKFYGREVHDCVVHLYDALCKYSPGKGKAFSYFNMVAINWVWANMKIVSESNNKVDLSEVDKNRNIDVEYYRQESLNELSEFCQKWSTWGNTYLDHLFVTQREKKIANAIFTLFKDCEFIDIYNKKALYILIREQVDVKTQYITDVIRILKPLFKEMYQEYRVNGTKNWSRYLLIEEEY